MAITKIQSESLNLADTYDFTGTVTGAGGVNTPAFYATRTGGNQSMSDNTFTKAQINSELYDTAKKGDIVAYHQIQDYLVWYVMRKIVAYDVPVQFHLAVVDPFVDDFDPLNLAVFLQDKELAESKIVVLHGGYPRYENAEALALARAFPPNNVYLDVSGRITLFGHPRILARTLSVWLEKPVLWNKIVYGSDVIWGERHIYTCARVIRDSVFYALSDMIDKLIIDEDTAITIARNILRENAKKLYKL